jgi:putative membrane protein
MAGKLNDSRSGEDTGLKMNRYVVLYLKGVAMGAADVIPGVSGGTIAFISGIYEELILAIRSFDIDALRMLKQFDLKGLWRHIHGTFLTVLCSGIGTSLLAFSRVILYGLTHYPEMVWSFFFGLVIASAWMVSGKIHRWNAGIAACAAAGGCIGYYITVAVPAQTPDTFAFIFFSGAIAICAMILPGISGSFILVLLSKYEYVFMAIKDFNLPVLIVFGTGCVLGILSFSHLLNWMLKRFYDQTIAALTGLMVGSLNKVWPWKEVIQTYTTPSGKVKPLIEHNILPASYLEITGKDPFLVSAVILGLAGFILVYLLEKISNQTPADS